MNSLPEDLRRYIENVDMTFAFRWLMDEKRTLMFKKAIDKVVKEGDIVADLGTGTGILAMFAVDAGAEKVYAVEANSQLCKFLKEIFKENGYENIHLIQGDARKITLPEKIDVAICEMISTGLIKEMQVPVMNNVLKYLKPN
jgi:predicted RNA methylase